MISHISRVSHIQYHRQLKLERILNPPKPRLADASYKNMLEDNEKKIDEAIQYATKSKNSATGGEMKTI